MIHDGRERFSAMRDRYRESDMSKIDYGIRAFIRDLNSHGYITLFSCAGHSDTVHSNGKLTPDNSGYVVIKGSVNVNDVKNIARKYVDGVAVRLVRMTNQHGSPKTYSATSVTFKSKNLTHWRGG